MRERFPFRLGATSFVHHPAGLLEHIERLTGHADDVELILWDSEQGGCNFPTTAEAARLRRTAAAHGMTLTAHLPLDVPGSDAMQQAQRVMAAGLRPWAYVFHVEEGSLAAPDRVMRGIRQLEAWADAPLALENLESYPPAHLEPIFDALPLTRAIDVGHAWKRGDDPLLLLREWLPGARVVHLHGFDGHRDHLPLDVMPPAALDPVVRLLRGFHGVVTLEVFRWAEFTRSRTALHDSLTRIAKDNP
jgi:sugar phosphate isomerase/epimerase